MKSRSELHNLIDWSSISCTRFYLKIQINHSNRLSIVFLIRLHMPRWLLSSTNSHVRRRTCISRNLQQKTFCFAFKVAIVNSNQYTEIYILLYLHSQQNKIPYKLSVHQLKSDSIIIAQRVTNIPNVNDKPRKTEQYVSCILFQQNFLV